MWIRETVTAGDLVHLATHMRDQDAREVFALRQGEDRVGLAYGLYAAMPRVLHAFVCGLDKSQNATAFLGIWAMDETGGLASANLFATADFPHVAGALVRHVRRTVIPALLARGCRRVECRALADYRTTRRFLRACLAREEVLLPDYGKNREPFVLYAWTRSDMERQHVHRRDAFGTQGADR
jgi:hypothetical protein